MSDDADLDRHGVNGQQLQATVNDDNLSANMAASTSSVKLKGKAQLMILSGLFLTSLIE